MVAVLFGLLYVAMGSRGMPDHWVRLDTPTSVSFVRRSAIVSVTENRGELEKMQGKVVVELVNGDQIHLDDIRAQQLIELIDR